MATATRKRISVTAENLAPSDGGDDDRHAASRGAASPVASASPHAHAHSLPAGELRLCGFTLQRREVALIVAVLVLHTAVTVFEELLFTTPGFHFGMFLSFTTMLLMSLIFGVYMTAAELVTSGQWPFAAALAELRRLASTRSARQGLFFVFGCYTLSTSLSKVSLAYISVPLQVVVKSSKIIPVMLGGRFITGTRYSKADYAGAVLLAAGVALFSGAGGNLSAAAAEQSSSSALAIGMGLLALTLCADALLGNWQERTMKESCISPSQMMLCQSVFAAGVSALAALATGEMEGGMLLLRAPGGGRIAWLLVTYATVMLLGTTAILTLVESYGAAAAVLVTLVRKCSSMFFSFMLWPKPLSWLHLLGATLVFAAPFAAKRATKGGSSGGGGGKSADLAVEGGRTSVFKISPGDGARASVALAAAEAAKLNYGKEREADDKV